MPVCVLLKRPKVMTANQYKKQKTEKHERPSGLGRFIAGMLDGSLISGNTNLHAMRFILFLFALALFFIFNTYYAERKTREAEQLRHEMTELRIRYIQTRSDYMFLTKQSEMVSMLSSQGFVEPVEPPRQIIVSEEKKTWYRFLGWFD